MIRAQQFVLAAVLLSAHFDINASERYLDYFDKEPGLERRAYQRAYEQIMLDLDSREYLDAAVNMDTFMDRVDPELLHPLVYANLLGNAGILKALTTEVGPSLLLMEKAIEIVEAEHGPFQKDLVRLLVAKAVIEIQNRFFEAAEQDLRRAQHITHRYDGVYTRDQLGIVDRLTDLSLMRGNVLDADREQRFNLKISEQVYGGKSEELVPVLERLGEYFASRGFVIPNVRPSQETGQISRDDLLASSPSYRAALFRESLDLYERAIEIVENNYGPNDLRLIEPLKGLARTRLKQGTARGNAEDAMERALDIVRNNPQTDASDHARALVDLGDIYTITSDKRAEDRYAEAWELLTENDLIELRNAFFGTPTKLFPDHAFVRVLDRRPIAAEEDETLFAEVEFSVVDDGRVSEVRVLEGNIPNDDKSVLRNALRHTRYRPRLVDGKPVNTDGLTILQTYEVRPRQPEAGISISVQ